MPDLVRTLAGVAARCCPGLGPGALRLKARMVAAGLRHRAHVAAFCDPPPGSALARIMAERPQILGALIWPYQCAAREAPEPLDRIAPP